MLRVMARGPVRSVVVGTWSAAARSAELEKGLAGNEALARVLDSRLAM